MWSSHLCDAEMRPATKAAPQFLTVLKIRVNPWKLSLGIYKEMWRVVVGLYVSVK